MNYERLLYFITTDRQSFPVKIGKSSPAGLGRRFSVFQTALPWKLRILLVLECDDAFEREMHREFKEDRIRGEWFVPTIATLNLVEEVGAHQASARLLEMLNLHDWTIEYFGFDSTSSKRRLATIRINGQDVGDILIAERLARRWPDGDEWWCR